MVFCSALMLHPLSMNCVASQSRSSRCMGQSPCEPKSCTVLTNPVPKYICQKRFTVTRAVSGFRDPPATVPTPDGYSASLLQVAEEWTAHRERPFHPGCHKRRASARTYPAVCPLRHHHDGRNRILESLPLLLCRR